MTREVSLNGKQLAWGLAGVFLASVGIWVFLAAWLAV